jgi:hypothetical protein
MRRWLFPTGVVIALLIGVHYAPWHWANTGSDFHQAKAADQSGHQTCGIVANVYHDLRGKGQPTFVDLGQPYPHQAFTVVIWQRDLKSFDPPPESWQGKHICVTGQIKTHKGKPEIIAYGPDQVQFKK